MKIIAGEFGGRILKAPKGDVTRPTTSLVRKALFDICMAHTEDALFLDLFSGSGALGIEALSRGARHATFIERDRNALRCLNENLKMLGLESRSTVLSGDVFSYLKKFKTPFDLITADPPYHDKIHTELLHIIDEKKLVKNGGLLFIEAPLNTKIEIPLLNLQPLEPHKYSKTVLHQWTSKNS